MRANDKKIGKSWAVLFFLLGMMSCLMNIAQALQSERSADDEQQQGHSVELSRANRSAERSTGSSNDVLLIKARDQIQRLRSEKDALADKRAQLSSALSSAQAENEQLTARVNTLTVANQQLSLQATKSAAPKDVSAEQRIKDAEAALKQANERLNQERARANQAEDAMIKAQFNINQQAGGAWSEKDLEDVALRAGENLEELRNKALEGDSLRRHFDEKLAESVQQKITEAEERAKQIKKDELEQAVAAVRGQFQHSLDEAQNRVRDFDNLKLAHSNLTDQLNNLTRQHTESLRGEKQQLANEYEGKLAQLKKEKDVEIANVGGRLRDEEQKNLALRGDIVQLNTQLLALTTSKKAQEALLARAQQEHAEELTRQREDYEKQLGVKDKELNQKKAALVQVNELLEKKRVSIEAMKTDKRKLNEKHKKRFEKIRDDLAAVQNENAALRAGQADAIQKALAEKDVRIKELERSNAQFADEKDAFEARIAELAVGLTKQAEESQHRITAEATRADAAVVQQGVLEKRLSEKDVVIARLEKEALQAKTDFAAQVAELNASHDRALAAKDSELSHEQEKLASVKDQLKIATASNDQLSLELIASKELVTTLGTQIEQKQKAFAATEKRLSDDYLREIGRLNEEHARALHEKDAANEQAIEEQKRKLGEEHAQQLENLRAQQKQATDELEEIKVILDEKERELQAVGVSTTAEAPRVASGEGTPTSEATQRSLKDRIDALLNLFISFCHSRADVESLESLRARLAAQETEQSARAAELAALAERIEKNAAVKRVLLGIIAYFDICAEIVSKRLVRNLDAKAMGFCYLVKNSQLGPDQQKAAIARVRSDLGLNVPTWKIIDGEGADKLNLPHVAQAFSALEDLLPGLKSTIISSEYNALKRRLGLAQ